MKNQKLPELKVNKWQQREACINMVGTDDGKESSRRRVQISSSKLGGTPRNSTP